MKVQKTKRLVVGDIHGNYDKFNAIYDLEKPEYPNTTLYEVITLGDYFDTFENITPEQQFEGFKNLLALQKKHNKEEGLFYMLVGNHDFHYLIDGDEKYSGYNQMTQLLTGQLLKDCVKSRKLRFSFVDMANRIIYSHAGVTNKWINERHKVSIPINMIDLDNFNNFKFTYGSHFDFYGNDPLNGPLWVRPEALLSDMYEDYDYKTQCMCPWTQIVGHTKCKEPIIAHEDGSKWKPSEDWCTAKFYDIDCLEKGYYVVEWLDEEGYVTNREVKQLK